MPLTSSVWAIRCCRPALHPCAHCTAGLGDGFYGESMVQEITQHIILYIYILCLIYINFVFQEYLNSIWVRQPRFVFVQTFDIFPSTRPLTDGLVFEFRLEKSQRKSVIFPAIWSSDFPHFTRRKSSEMWKKLGEIELGHISGNFLHSGKSPPLIGKSTKKLGHVP